MKNCLYATDEGLSPKRLAFKKTFLALHCLLFLIFGPSQQADVNKHVLKPNVSGLSPSSVAYEKLSYATDEGLSLKRLALKKLFWHFTSFCF